MVLALRPLSLPAAAPLTPLGSGVQPLGITPLTAGQNYTSPFGQGLDKVVNFGISTLESLPEMFGIEPSQRTQAFRVANPVSGFLSQVVGSFIPYMGEAKLLRMVPMINDSIMAAKAAGALRGPALASAFEVGTEAAAVGALNTAVAATPLPGAIETAVTGTPHERTEPLGDIALGNAFNAGAGLVLGGVGGLIAKRFAMGRQLSDIVPEFNPQAPVLDQIRALNAAYAAHIDPSDPFKFSSEEDALRVTHNRDRLMQFNAMDKVPYYTETGDVREQVNPNTERVERWADHGPIFRDLESEVKSRRTGNYLRSISRVGDRPDTLTETKRLVFGPGDPGSFQTEADFANTMDAAGVNRETLLMNAQDIRVFKIREGEGRQPENTVPPPQLEFNLDELPSSMAPEQAAGRRLLTNQPEWNKAGSFSRQQGKANAAQRFFTSTPFRDVGQGWRMAREKNDGLFVFAKKVGGDISAPKPGDSWLVFRTDRPEVFADRAAALNEKLAHSNYFPTELEHLTSGEPLYDAGLAIRKMAGGDNILMARRVARGKAGAWVRGSLNTAATKLAPSAPLFEKHPTANYAWRLAKGIEQVAEGRIQTLMNGFWKPDPNKSGFANVMSLRSKMSEGVNAAIKALSPAALTDIKTALETRTPFAVVHDLHARGRIDQGAYNFLALMQGISDSFEKRVEAVGAKLTTNQAQQLLGDFVARQGHYAISRDYPGAYKMLLHNEAGEVVGWAPGESPLEARQAADKIILEQAKLGKKVTAQGMVDEAYFRPELYGQIKSALMKPGFIRGVDKEFIGYELTHGELTNKKLSELVEKNIRRRENYLRDVAILEHTAEPIAQLARSEPQLANALVNALARMRGDEGEFARITNKMMDTALHAVGLSGKDSASAIVKNTQKVMSAFQFTFGSFVQPVQNMVGNLQTVLPEIAFVLHADEATLARNYVSFPFYANGSVQGTFGMLSEVKLFKNSLDRLTVAMKDQPQDYQELLNHMMSRRVINSRFVEEQYGMDGYLLTNMRQAFKEGHSIVDVFNAGNQLMMSKSEELNRLIATNAAYEIAKARGLEPGRLIHFATEFVAKTAYNYATHDRAAVFTTPLGSLAGTFKNWMFHYMGSMIKYSTAGPAGMKALAWQTATTGLFGGAAATPLLLPLANAASQWMSNKSAMQNLYDTTIGLGLPERVADGVMYGLPGALGVSLSSQVASPGSDPARDATMLFSFAAFDRMKALSNGTQAALLAYQATGQNPFQAENVRDELMRALAPRSIYRAMSIGTNGAIRSLNTGYDVYRGGLGSAALYAAGFNPTELEKTYAVYNQVRDDQNAQRALVQQFGQGMAQAWEDGDERLANRIFARALATGVDVSSVMRSAQSRQQRGQETQLEFQATPEDQQNYSFEFNQPQQ